MLVVIAFVIAQIMDLNGVSLVTLIDLLIDTVNHKNVTFYF